MCAGGTHYHIQFIVLEGMEPRALCRPAKPSTNWATSPALKPSTFYKYHGLLTPQVTCFPSLGNGKTFLENVDSLQRRQSGKAPLAAQLSTSNLPQHKQPHCTVVEERGKQLTVSSRRQKLALTGCWREAIPWRPHTDSSLLQGYFPEEFNPSNSPENTPGTIYSLESGHWSDSIFTRHACLRNQISCKNHETG